MLGFGVSGRCLISRALLSNVYSSGSMATSTRPSSDMAKFREVYKKSKHVVVLTGAGVSAESGIPTFRGAGGLWRKWVAQDLATPGAFARDPSLVWEFYHHRREVVFTKHPNPAHLILAEAEQQLSSEGRRLVVITQNVDGLHKKAGSKEVIELHGSILKTRCTKCGDVQQNTDSPICPSLAGRGSPDPDAVTSRIPEPELPHCQKCSGLLRPHVVWFGESYTDEVLERAGDELDACDLCLIVGTSSVVYPAAMFAPQVAARGVPVAEFNVETTPVTHSFSFYFEGPCGSTLPEALAL